MTTFSRVQRQRGLKFAVAVSDMAAKAPDDEIKSRMYSVVDATRKKYGYSHEQKKSEIERCISLGARTCAEMTNETSFSKQNILEIFNELVRERKLRIEYVQLGDRGPKTAHYFPVDTQ